MCSKVGVTCSKVDFFWYTGYVSGNRVCCAVKWMCVIKWVCPVMKRVTFAHCKVSQSRVV